MENNISQTNNNVAKNNSSETATRKDIAELLLDKKIITKDQLDVALKEKQEKNISENIGTILVNMGLITDSMLSEVLNEQTGNKEFNLKYKPKTVCGKSRYGVLVIGLITL